MRTLQRVSSMQLYLMDALGEEDPQQAVVERLSTFLDATVVLFSADGAVAASTGDAPAADIWREVTSRPATVVEFDVGDGHVLATPVSTGGAPAGWLAVTQPAGVAVAAAGAPGGARDRAGARRAQPHRQPRPRAAAGGPRRAARRDAQAARRRATAPRSRPAPRRWASTSRPGARGGDLRPRDAHGAGRRSRARRSGSSPARSPRAASPRLPCRRPGDLTALVQAPHADLRAVLDGLVERWPGLVGGRRPPGLRHRRGARVPSRRHDRGAAARRRARAGASSTSRTSTS